MRGLILSILIVSTINLSSCRNFLESGEKCQNELIADHCDNPSKSDTSHHLSFFLTWSCQMNPVEPSQVKLCPFESNQVQSSPIYSIQFQSSPVEFSPVEPITLHIYKILWIIIQVLMGQVMSVTVKNITNVRIMDCGWCAVLPICISMKLCNNAKTQVIQVASKIQFASPVQPPV